MNGLYFASALFSLCLILAACTWQSSDADRLADHIVEMAPRTANAAGETLTEEYPLQHTGPYVVAILPAGASTAQLGEALPVDFAKVIESDQRKWPGRPVVAVFRGDEFSAVDYVGDYVVIDRPMLALKRPGERLRLTVTRGRNRVHLSAIE